MPPELKTPRGDAFVSTYRLVLDVWLTRALEKSSGSFSIFCGQFPPPEHGGCRGGSGEPIKPFGKLQDRFPRVRIGRSTAQPLPVLAPLGRAIPRLRSKSMAFLVLPRLPFLAPARSISAPECLKSPCPRHLLTILYEQSRRMKPKTRSSSRKIERVRGQGPSTGRNGEK